MDIYQLISAVSQCFCIHLLSTEFVSHLKVHCSQKIMALTNFHLAILNNRENEDTVA